MGKEEKLMQVELEYMERFERGDAPSLEELVETYPDLREELTEFLFEFVSLENVSDRSEPSEEGLRSAAVARKRAMEELHSQPESLREARELSGEKLTTLAEAVRVPADVLLALEQGMLRVDTVPRKLVDRIGSVLDLPQGLLRQMLGTPILRTQPTHFRTQEKEGEEPKEDPRQMSFAEALRKSPGCNEELLKEWLPDGDHVEE